MDAFVADLRPEVLYRGAVEEDASAFIAAFGCG